MSEENALPEQPEPPSDEPPHRELAPMFTDGGRPGPGRPKGSANKSTVAIRNAISAVFEDLQLDHKGEGSFPHFFEWAKANPTEFYRMAARQLPVRIEAGSQTIGMVVFRGLND
jgi:hypothetical protein